MKYLFLVLLLSGCSTMNRDITNVNDTNPVRTVISAECKTTIIRENGDIQILQSGQLVTYPTEYHK